MHIGQLYNKVASTYNQEASGEVLDKAKQMALELAIGDPSEKKSILALGVGDGTDLLPYVEHYTTAELHGLDISENMLKKVSEILHCTTYHGDISCAADIIKKHDFDFIIAHFVTAYVPLPIILRESKELLASNGTLSILTNTMSSFPMMQSIIPKLQNSPNPIHKLIARHVHKTLDNVYVPKNLEHLRTLIETNGYKLQAIDEKNIELQLNSEKEIFNFFIKGGWFLSGLMHPLFPSRLISQVCAQLIHKYCPVPFVDRMKIAMAIVEPKN
jgi:ubiquinone/menaquinone biosynthesis C-methylase UbiE